MTPPADMNLLSNWIPYKSSNCKKCHSTCCQLPVEVSLQDLLRLELITHEEASGSPKKIAKRLQKEKIVKNYRDRTGIFTLWQKANNDCLYLDEQRRCTVYEKRPEVCRLFPTQVGPRVKFCPFIPREK